MLATASSWDNAHNLMYVVGATQAEALHQIRAIVPNAFLLVPGVGAQGGDLNHVFAQGHNAQCGLLVNASRSIIYAGSDEQFASSAAQQALQLQQQMEVHLTENNCSNAALQGTYLQKAKRSVDYICSRCRRSSAIWFRQIRYFSRHFNLLLIDLRGHGKSKGSLDIPSNNYTFAAIAEEIFEVIDHLKITASHFAGISLERY